MSRGGKVWFMDKWFVIKIVGRSEGPLRVKVKGPNEAIRVANNWIQMQIEGNDDGNGVNYSISNIYLDPNQEDQVKVSA